MRKIILAGWCWLILGTAAWAQTPDDCYANEAKPQKRQGLLTAWRRSWPIYPACGSNKSFQDFGCNGWKADCRFIFGSCWEFFNEPCPMQQGPPWHRHIEGLGPMKGYGHGARRPCNDW